MRDRVELHPKTDNARNGEGGDMGSIKPNGGEQMITTETPTLRDKEITGRGSVPKLAGELAVLLERNGGRLPIVDLIDKYREKTYRNYGIVWDALDHAVTCEPPLIVKDEDEVHVSLPSLESDRNW
jgi:hypothetical protein